MPAVGQLSAGEVIVSPGADETVRLTVRNLGSAPGSFSLVASGFVQGWTVIDPPLMTLPPSGEGTATLSLRPPRHWSVPAGSSPLVIRIVSGDIDDDVTIVEGTVSVLAFDERRLSLAQSVQRAKRTAEYDVVLENLGNARAAVRLALSDPGARLRGDFAPPSIGVDPGQSAVSRLRVRSTRRRWRRGPRLVPFTVEASQDGHHPATTGGTLFQVPLVAGRTLSRIVALLAIGGALAGAWFGLFRPAIDEAAERAVADWAVTQTTMSTPAVGGPATSIPNGERGEPFAVRLVTEALLGGQAVQSYTVPDGKRLQITDVLWQNPNDDRGRLALLRNSVSLYEISLANFTDYAQALISPYVFGPGESVNLQLSCTRIGSAEAGTCSVAVTLTGRLLDG